MNKIHEWVNTALIAAVFILVLVGGNQSGQTLLGGVTNYGALNVTESEGYQVNGTTIINGSTGAISTSGGITTTGSGGITSAGTATFDGKVLYSSANSTSTPASMTMRESDFAGYSSLLITPTVGAVTMTLPASSTISTLIPSTGDWVDFTVVNATTSAFAITFAGATGVTLQQASSTLVLGNQQIAVLRLIRLASTDIIGYFSQAF